MTKTLRKRKYDRIIKQMEQMKEDLEKQNKETSNSWQKQLEENENKKRSSGHSR